MDSFLLDTNIIIDAFSAKILNCLNYQSFYVSKVVLKEEIEKQIPKDCNCLFNLINESIDEFLNAEKYRNSNKKVSFYDALNLSIAKARKMILVTGDQTLKEFAKKHGVICIGTIKLIEILLDKELINADESIKSLKRLKEDSSRRIPHNLIDSLIEKIQEKYNLVR